MREQGSAGSRTSTTKEVAWVLEYVYEVPVGGARTGIETSIDGLHLTVRHMCARRAPRLSDAFGFKSMCELDLLLFYQFGFRTKPLLICGERVRLLAQAGERVSRLRCWPSGSRHTSRISTVPAQVESSDLLRSTDVWSVRFGWRGESGGAHSIQKALKVAQPSLNSAHSCTWAGKRPADSSHAHGWQQSL